MSNALLALIAQRKAQSTRIDTLSPKTGRNRYRLLPSWRVAASAPTDIPAQDWVAKFMAASVANNMDVMMKMAELAQGAPAGYDTTAKLQWMLTFYADFGQHFVKDAAGQVKAVATCPSKTHGRPCAICDEIGRGLAQAKSLGDELAEKRIKDMGAGARVLINVLDLGGPTPSQPQILQIAPSAFNGKKGVGGILSLFTDWPNMLNLVGGADIIIEKQGTGMDTAYGVSAIPSQTNVDIALLTQIANLDNFVNRVEADSGQRAIAGVAAMTGLLPAPQRPSLAQLANASAMLDDVPSFAAAAPAAAINRHAAMVQQEQPQQYAPAQQQQAAIDPAFEALFGLSQQPVEQFARSVQAAPVAQPVQQVVQAAPVAQPVQAAASSSTEALDALLAGL